MTVRYYDLRTNWRKVKRHIDHPDVQKILVRDFNRYTWGRWRQKFEAGMLPTAFESCDWQFDHKGRRPAFWRYTKHAACHWLVNFALALAQRVEPKREWRIITSQEHSTVWDGGRLLFDLNFQPMDIAPEECFDLAYEQELAPGEFLKVHLAQHWKSEQREREARKREEQLFKAVENSTHAGEDLGESLTSVKNLLIEQYPALANDARAITVLLRAHAKWMQWTSVRDR